MTQTIDYVDRDIPVELLMAARQDQAAMKKATQAGKPIPATPNLDEYHRRYAEMTNTRKTTTKGSARTPGVKQSTKVRFTHDGMPMHESHMLGGVAYHYTEGLGEKGGKLDSKGLAALLTKLGVKDIYEPGWSVKLANGITIGAIKPEHVDAARTAAKKNGKATVTKKPAGTTSGASKPSKPKGTVKKQTPGAKARAAAAAKAPAKRQVTPIPKKRTTKKAAPKKTMARKAS